MTPPATSERYKNHRFPGEISGHGVWLSYRFPLSYRDVPALLCERGIAVTHEATRQWCLQFGQDYAKQRKHRRPRPGDTWHLAAVFLTINGPMAQHFRPRRPRLSASEYRQARRNRFESWAEETGTERAA